MLPWEVVNGVDFRARSPGDANRHVGRVALELDAVVGDASNEGALHVVGVRRQKLGGERHSVTGEEPLLVH